MMEMPLREVWLAPLSAAVVASCALASGINDWSLGSDGGAAAAAGLGSGGGGASAGGERASGGVDSAAGPHGAGGGAGGGSIVCDSLAAQLLLYRGHCYWLFGQPLNWMDAVDACSGLGSDIHLLTLNDVDESQAVSSAFGGDRFWAGASDLGSEGAFAWDNGEPWSYAAWAPNQPDDYQQQDCLSVLGNGLWDDQQCWASHVYVCEQSR